MVAVSRLSSAVRPVEQNNPTERKQRDTKRNATDDANPAPASAFGQDTSTRAKAQQDADVETRSQFGRDQSVRAKDQGTDRDDDDGTDDGDDGG